MSTVYNARVHTREVSYTTFGGQEKTVELHFALDPLKLMSLMSAFEPKTSKSKNPAKAGQPEISSEQQLAFVRKLVEAAAGFPSEDGESWEPFPEIGDSLAGQAFLTQLTASDGERREFTETVMLAPFRAFVEFARDDKSNNPAEIKDFEKLLVDFEKLFAPKDATPVNLADRRAQLQAELAAMPEGDGSEAGDE